MTDLSTIIQHLHELDASSLRGGVSSIHIESQINDHEIIIGANQEGLVHLALQLLRLAEKNSAGSHVHVDAASVAASTSKQVVLRVSRAPWA